MKRGQKYNYEILKHNFRDFNLATFSLAVVKGEAAAERAVERYDRELSDEEKQAGWGHFSQRTTKPVSVKVVRTRRPYKDREAKRQYKR